MTRRLTVQRAYPPAGRRGISATAESGFRVLEDDMHTQLPLLSDAPIARSSDPSTSHAAAAHVTRSGARASQQAHVLAMIKRQPGLTTAELAEAFGVNRFVVARRAPELAATDKARKGASRTCTVTGRESLTWWPK